MQSYATTEELAVRYRVTVETIRAWARQGVVPVIRIGRRPLLFETDKVDRALRMRTPFKQKRGRIRRQPQNTE